MNPYDRLIELLVGYAFAITGGVFIIQAMPDYGTGVLLMFGVLFLIVGIKVFDRKKEEPNDSQS